MRQIVRRAVTTPVQRFPRRSDLCPDWSDETGLPEKAQLNYISAHINDVGTHAIDSGVTPEFEHHLNSGVTIVATNWPR